jgi:AsmA protein
MASAATGFVRRHPAWTAAGFLVIVLLVGSVVLLSNLHWLRGPLERAASARLDRAVAIGDLQLRWSGQPVLVLNGVELGNLRGGSEARMARAASMELTLSLLNLLRGHLVVPKLAMNDVDVLLEQLPDGRRNWVIGNEDRAKTERPRSRLRLGSVVLNRGRVRYLDHTTPIDMTVLIRSLEGPAATVPRGNEAAARNARYGLVYDIQGHYRGNRFSGQARSGGVVSLADSGEPFPLQLDLTAGETHLALEGMLADATQLSGIDMRLQMAGPTLANIYPLLLLPLPASPPYRIQGRLRRDGSRFALEEIRGRIGSTDFEGQGSYVVQKPRPMLALQLRSKLLNMPDLGPLIGVETKSRSGKTLDQAKLSNRAEAKQTDQQKRGERVLPAGRFEADRLRQIDADFRLQAHRVKGLASVPLEDFDGTLRLRDAVLKLDGLKLGVAGGTLLGRATLDARDGETLHSHVQTELRGLQLDQLLKGESALAKGAGSVSMKAELRGSGNSIADAAAKADGQIAATMSEGRVSNLLDAASGLALGRVLALLVTGDREIPLNCGATVFEVQKGKGQTTLFVLDTAQTQVIGAGAFDLAQEVFALHVEPKPKKKGLLSLRTPIDIKGTFSRADVVLDKKPLLARAGAALALAVVNPFAALLPLIETGPGKDTPCASVMREAEAAKQKSSAPSASAPSADVR